MIVGNKSEARLVKKGENASMPLPVGKGRGWQYREVPEDVVIISLSPTDAMNGGIAISAKEIRKILKGE